MKLNFRNRVLFTILMTATLCTTAAIFVAKNHIYVDGKNGLVDKSRAILSRAQSGTQYVAEMGILKGLIQDAVTQHPDGVLGDEEKKRIFQSVPIVAGMKIAARDAEKDRYEFRVSSDSARNQKNTASAEERAIIERFRNESGLEEVVEESKDGAFVKVSRPVRLSEAQGCLHCHGHPSKSPWKNGKDVLGYQMEDMKDGYIKGVFTIVSSLEPVKAQAQQTTKFIGGIAILFALISLVVGFFIVKGPIQSLFEVSRRLGVSAESLTETSSQIAQASSTISEGTTEQAAALQETAASVDEISAMVKKTTENASESGRYSQQSHETAKSGEESMQEMVRVIGRISESNADLMKSVKEGNQEISGIMKVIAEIEMKTKVINDIVFQTKLLSFNASVEAARAGEHGKGFAVVAEEVGKLAQMSGSSAKEISDLLAESVHKVEGILKQTQERVENVMVESQKRITEGTETAQICEKSLTEILKSVSLVDERVGEIVHASREQNQGIAEINKAMSQLTEATEVNSKVAQDAAQSAGEVQTQSEELREAVVALSVILDGQAGVTGARTKNERQPVATPKKEVVALKKSSPDLTVVPKADDDRFSDVA